MSVRAKNDVGSGRRRFVLGFTYVEILVVVILAGIGAAFLMDIVPGAVRAFFHSAESNKLYFLAREKLAEIELFGVWIEDVDTQNPNYPTATRDPANLWKQQLDMGVRDFSANVRGEVSVSLLDVFYAPAAGGDVVTPRERFEITITMSQDANMAALTTYVTINASHDSLMGILRVLKRALRLYREVNGFYPASGNLAALVPHYLPFIPNNPYTTYTTPMTTGAEEAGDYFYNNSGGVITLYARTHLPADYPALVLIW